MLLLAAVADAAAAVGGEIFHNLVAILAGLKSFVIVFPFPSYFVCLQ